MKNQPHVLRGIGVQEMYLYGSRMYETHRHDSDYDYIVIVDEYPKEGTLVIHEDYSFHLYTPDAFRRALDNHDVAIVETVYLHQDVPEDFTLDNNKLRVAFSTVANHSWVKGKKKLIVSADYDKLAGIKSVFHSIRILDYGIQLATTNSIHRPKEYNWLMDELYSLAEKYERDELWDLIDTRYRSLFKDLKSQFKGHAPKPLTSQRAGLEAVLEKHGVKKNTELISDIIKIFVT